MDLTETLQRLYEQRDQRDHHHRLWDDSDDFALISYMEWEEAGRPNRTGLL